MRVIAEDGADAPGRGIGGGAAYPALGIESAPNAALLDAVPHVLVRGLLSHVVAAVPRVSDPSGDEVLALADLGSRWHRELRLTGKSGCWRKKRRADGQQDRRQPGWCSAEQCRGDHLSRPPVSVCRASATRSSPPRETNFIGTGESVRDCERL